MLESVDSGESLPLEQVKRLFGAWFSAAAVVLVFSCSIEPASPKEWKDTHTPSSLACCSQADCSRLALPLTMSFTHEMGKQSAAPVARTASGDR